MLCGTKIKARIAEQAAVFQKALKHYVFKACGRTSLSQELF